MSIEEKLPVCTSRQTWKRGRFLMGLPALGYRFGFPLLLFVALLLGVVSSARAGDFCSDAPYFGVIDGDVLGTPPIQITIDRDCTFQNWPQSNPLTTTINFQTNDPTIYLIIFDNVYFIGNMACANVDHRIWFSNGSDYGSNNACQDLFIPVETIKKENPSGQVTASIGVPFTYTLTLPSMQLSGDPSINDLHTITITDDLTAGGAELSYVSHRAYIKSSGAPVTLGFTNPDNKHLTFTYGMIPAGTQIVIELTVVLDDTSTNVSGTQFTNTAKWWFGRLIDGVYYEPLPGEWGVTQPMIIAEPNLVVTKTSSETALNLGVPSVYTIDVQNTGGSDAWDVTILDQLPDSPNGGMCDFDPTTASGFSVQVFGADGVTPVSGLLVKDTDYTVTYSGAPTCQLRLTTLTSAAVIGPSEHLVITYQSQLDGDSTSGIPLTNVAGVTRWFNGDSGLAGRQQYDRGPLTDGTPGVSDFQDSATVTTALSGYYFQKTVGNLNSGANPATTAAPGDRLHYRLRLFNVDQTINGITISDLLDANSFELNTFTMVTPLPAGATYSFDPASGLLTISGNITPLNVAVGGELVIEFEITLKSTLTNNTVVENQASFTATGITAQSDDPYVNGIAPPGYPADPTSVVINAPGPLLKVNTQSTAVIGAQFKYRITVPATPVSTALYDVRILDDLSTSAADMRFVSVAKISGSGSWTPVNSGSDTNLVIEDTVIGIDIPAGEQIVIEVTVELQNTPTNVVGLSFTNTADYTYNRINNTSASQANGLPGTTAPMQIFGLVAQKTVSIAVDNNSNGLVDPGDVLLYTITVNNPSTVPATGLVLIDDVPANTTYWQDSVTLNGQPVGQPDSGILPLTSGIAINSAGSISGTIAALSSAVVTFRVQVIAGVSAGTVISNQGYVTGNEQPTVPTDADGNAANGYQPTTIVVGSDQQVMITKEVSVVGGGAALPGSELEYVVTVTNTGTVATTDLVITDNLTSLTGMATYVAGSATLNSATTGVNYNAPVLTADYASIYGNLLPGTTATLRFRVLIDIGIASGTRITNTAQMSWNTPTLTTTASVSIDVGGVTGSAALNGQVWHDSNLDKVPNTNETYMTGWSVDLYRNDVQISSAVTDTNGYYSFSGLEPTLTSNGQYELHFTAPGAGPNTASMGQCDSTFTNGPQRISNIIAISGANLQNLNLPLWPNGVVYNSVLRTAVADARVTLLNAATHSAVSSQCFDDPVQQNQSTGQEGFYKFDLNFSDASCPSGGTYLISVTPPATGYQIATSQVILPISDVTTAPFSIPTCPGSSSDAIPTTQYCEVNASAAIPPTSVAPGSTGTRYYLHLLLDNGNLPGHSQIFNNAIPVDPVLTGAVAITKTSSMTDVTKGTLVPYTITATNVYGVPLYGISIVDRFPAGFKYVAGSARLDGAPAEPLINGRELAWDDLELQVDGKYTLQLLLIVGSGVSEGEYVNRAFVRNSEDGAAISEEATATVLVVPDPDFDCTDVIGKVFDDGNLNGQQDPGEKGLSGVRVVTARGLISTSDKHGRFHITCAAVPDENIGSNFILKLDERSLPTGYRLTTENPRVQRATRGKMLRFNFGATIHRVVRIDISDGVFEPDTAKLRTQWTYKIDQLFEELKKAPSVLRLSYLCDVERKGLVQERLEALKKEITKRWDQSDGGYRLTIETEIFWRRGDPISGQ